MKESNMMIKMKNQQMKYTIIVFFMVFWSTGFTQQVNCYDKLNITITPDSKITLDGLSFGAVERSEGDVNRWKELYSGTSINSFTDETVDSGKKYMYRVKRFNASRGFASAGINIPPVFHRGRLLLLVDETHSVALAEKIQRWIGDAEGDGWTVITESINREMPVTMVKQIIQEKYFDDIGLQSVFLFGHIPVPYSGEFALDGHANHTGAWSADSYYAEMNEEWTDETVNRTGVPIRTQNIPGDGKFDQSTVRDLELEIGRVDFYDMPALGQSEEALLEKYLDKNHFFKVKGFTPKQQAFSQNNILNGGNPCTYGYMYLALVGAENVYTGDYRSTLTSDSYLFAYGAGFASFTSVGGISNTTNMGVDSLQAVFAASFGSYFGDWDSPDNYLRAQLASGTILTSHYSSGFKYYGMGLGNTIGHEIKLSVQGLNLSSIDRSANSVGLSLMGDPTLRMLMVYPVVNEEITYSENKVSISWEYLEDEQEINGFNIYRKSPSDDHYVFLESVPASQLDYTDNFIEESGETHYMIRTQKIEHVLAGSYYNQSVGNPTSIEVPFVDLDGDGFDSFEDCDDANVNIFPGQDEIQNNVDDNCNEYVDEVDADNDGFYDYEDCDDENAAINPLALEIINNGIDENCDGIDDLNPNCYAYDGIPSDVLLDIERCDDLPARFEEAIIYHNSSFIFQGENDRTYSFDYCENYDSQLWSSFTYVLRYNQSNRTIGELITYSEGCQLEFKFNETMAFPEYLIVVKDIEQCSSPQFVSSVANGILSINCVYIDQDNDGFFDYEDCDDNNAMVNSGQVEIPFNGLDDDCNGNTLDNDGDQDGSSIDEDCDDNNPLVSPDMIEIEGNGIDEDCDGIIDEVDMDGDGFDEFEGCDDSNMDIYPGAYDYANNGIDEDCDGIDYVTDTCTFYMSGPWDDFEGFGDYCLDGPITTNYIVQAFSSYALYNLTPNTTYHYSFCDSPNSDTWTPLITVVQYNQTSDLEGQIISASDSCEIYFNFPYDQAYPDVLIIVSDLSQDCNQPTSLPSYYFPTLACVEIDNDGDGYNLGEDCDDENPNVNAGAVEIPYNGIDDDCNGHTLDDDLDRDGFLLADDCDDNDPAVNSSATEIPYNGKDDDCDPITLDDDLDQDGFDLEDDCDDENPLINPDAIEITNNGIDEDCDGMDFISSVSEIENYTLVTYPNPTSTFLNIEVSGIKNYKIKLYDATGMLISAEKNTTRLSFSELSNGVYILIVKDTTSGMLMKEKIVKVN